MENRDIKFRGKRKDIGGWFIIEPHGVLPIRRFHTLHHLQLLVFALTQQPLKITLP